MDMKLPLIGPVNGKLELAEQVGDGRVRLTIYTQRFGRFVICVDKAEHVCMCSPAPVPSKESRA